MKSNFPKIIVLLILVFVAYKSLSHGIKAFKARPQASPSAEAPPAEVTTDIISPSSPVKETDTTVSVADKKQDVLSALNDYGRVPFIDPTETKTTTGVADAAAATRKSSFEAPQLTTILNYGTEWFAIVNGSLVKAGDTIGKIKILEVKENLVRIEDSGKTYRIKLWQESFSK